MTSSPPMKDPVDVQIERADLALLAAALERYGNAHTKVAEQGARDIERERQPGDDVRPAATRIMQLLAIAGTLHEYAARFTELAGGITPPAAQRHLQAVPADPAAQYGQAMAEAIHAVVTGSPAPPRPVAADLDPEQRLAQTVAELAAARPGEQQR